MIRPKSLLIHEYVTGGGLAGQALPDSWAIEGAAIRRALVADFAAVAGLEVTSTLDDRFDESSVPGRVVPVGPGAEWDVLGRVASEVDAVLIVAPETSGLLFERTRFIEEVGTQLLGSSSDAVTATGDKVRSAHIIESRGFPTPQTRVVSAGEPLPDDQDYPAILKPIDGAGSIETFVVKGADEASRWLATATRPAILQRLHPGRPLSAHFLVGTDPVAAHPIGVASQEVEIIDRRIHYRGGQVPARATTHLDRLRDLVRAIPGLKGWVGLDFLEGPEEGLVVLEINPRPTTAILGFCAILPTGTIAEAWLSALEGDRERGR